MTHRGVHEDIPGDAKASRKTRGRWHIVLAVFAAILLALSVLPVAAGCGGDSVSGPEEAVQKFLTAVENKDIDAVFQLIDQQTAAEMESQMVALGLTLEDAKALFADELFAFDSVEFSGVEFETKNTGKGEAVVTIVDGTLTQTSDGMTETVDAGDSPEAPAQFYLYEIDGKWYIDFESL